MSTVRSRDGTPIACEEQGSGPLLVLVDGALCARGIGPGDGLARLLGRDFRVVTYDRRGRGESGDVAPYDVERELEDLEAVIAAHGDDALVFGQSSGAVLALLAAARSSQITRLALYEAPFIVDGTRAPVDPGYIKRLRGALEQGARGEALRLFMRYVGLPAPAIAALRLTPLWRRLKAIAHTLPYDFCITGEFQQGRPIDPTRWHKATQPTLVMVGGNSGDWMINGMRALADALPAAQYLPLPRQTHHIKPKAVAPPVAKFLNGVGPIQT